MVPIVGVSTLGTAATNNTVPFYIAESHQN